MPDAPPTSADAGRTPVAAVRAGGDPPATPPAPDGSTDGQQGDESAAGETNADDKGLSPAELADALMARLRGKELLP